MVRRRLSYRLDRLFILVGGWICSFFLSSSIFTVYDTPFCYLVIEYRSCHLVFADGTMPRHLEAGYFIGMDHCFTKRTTCSRLLHYLLYTAILVHF